MLHSFLSILSTSNNYHFYVHSYKNIFIYYMVLLVSSCTTFLPTVLSAQETAWQTLTALNNNDILAF